MSVVQVSESDLEFLTTRAAELECTVEELLEQMILREKVLAKARPVVLEAAKPNMEPPHRKWGM